MIDQLGITPKDIIYLAFFVGVMWTQFQALRKDIARLEKKQDKYNNLQERTLELESWRKYHEKEHTAAAIKHVEVLNGVVK